MQSLMNTPILAEVFPLFGILELWQVIALVVLVVLVIVMMKIRNKQM